MNYHALLKLKNNPHYKLNESQKRQLAEYENDPIVLFGIVPKHENTFEQHKVKVKKIRTNKYGR